MTSFVGYSDQITNVNSSVVNVIMQLQSALDEVVVVAYGTQSKASLTGSVSVIAAEQIENSTSSNAAKSLEVLFQVLESFNLMQYQVLVLL